MVGAAVGLIACACACTGTSANEAVSHEPALLVDTSELTRRGGCADTFYAANVADTRVLTFTLLEPFDDGRYDDRAVVDQRLIFGNGEFSVTMVDGTDVTNSTCTTDARDRVVDRTWTAVLGSATVTTRAAADPGHSSGDLRLGDVVLESDDGQWTLLEHLEWTATPLGGIVD